MDLLGGLCGTLFASLLGSGESEVIHRPIVNIREPQRPEPARSIRFDQEDEDLLVLVLGALD